MVAVAMEGQQGERVIGKRMARLASVEMGHNSGNTLSSDGHGGARSVFMDRGQGRRWGATRTSEGGVEKLGVSTPHVMKAGAHDRVVGTHGSRWGCSALHGRHEDVSSSTWRARFSLT